MAKKKTEKNKKQIKNKKQTKSKPKKSIKVETKKKKEEAVEKTEEIQYNFKYYAVCLDKGFNNIIPEKDVDGTFSIRRESTILKPQEIGIFYDLSSGKITIRTYSNFKQTNEVTLTFNKAYKLFENLKK